ncbi:MAG: hypothetical protein U7126_28100 [Microcoleus sp.]
MQPPATVDAPLPKIVRRSTVGGGERWLSLLWLLWHRQRLNYAISAKTRC